MHTLSYRASRIKCSFFCCRYFCVEVCNKVVEHFESGEVPLIHVTLTRGTCHYPWLVVMVPISNDSFQRHRSRACCCRPGLSRSEFLEAKKFVSFLVHLKKCPLIFSRPFFPFPHLRNIYFRHCILHSDG